MDCEYWPEECKGKRRFYVTYFYPGTTQTNVIKRTVCIEHVKYIVRWMVAPGGKLVIEEFKLR
jgi:hypothetical protein